MSAVSPAPGSPGAAAASQGGERPFGIDFIDPLFAGAIHIGMVEGLMHEAWFKEWRVPERQQLFTVVDEIPDVTQESTWGWWIKGTAK